MFSSYLSVLEQNKAVDPLYVVLETWLRLLRDAGNKDRSEHFSFDLNESTISFSDPNMDPAERKRFAHELYPVLNHNRRPKLKRLTPSISDVPKTDKGCQFVFRVKQPRLFRRPPPTAEENEELFDALLDYGNRVGRAFYKNLKTCCYPDPLDFAAIPLTFLPAVWLSLKPKCGRHYPTLGNGFQNHVREEATIFHKQLEQDFSGKFPYSGFSLARLWETDRVWLLYDYNEIKEINKSCNSK